MIYSVLLLCSFRRWRRWWSNNGGGWDAGGGYATAGGWWRGCFENGGGRLNHPSSLCHWLHIIRHHHASIYIVQYTLDISRSFFFKYSQQTPHSSPSWVRREASHGWDVRRLFWDIFCEFKVWPVFLFRHTLCNIVLYWIESSLQSFHSYHCKSFTAIFNSVI